MRSNKYKIFLLTFFLIELLSLFLAIKSFSNKNIAETKEIYEIDKKQFSMYIENEEGNYEEYIESNKFPEGYQINIEKSKCVDTKGNVINGILTGNGTNITITSSKTSYCYLYFDIKELTASEYLIENVSSDMLWDSTLEGDGYRYIGTNPDNYICFGYDDVENDCDFTSTINTDLYAYRIIGIFEDEEGQQHLKLIKKEALNTSYVWTEDYLTDISWINSDLYKGLNESYFLTNPTYSYMQNSTWLNKIETWNYIATNTKTYVSDGPDYFDGLIVKNIYLHEMNRSSKTSSVGVWKIVNGKISLMYVSDYLLSLGSSALNYTSSSHALTLKTGWMHLSNNDNGAPSRYEWTSSRCDDIEFLYYNVWEVTPDGFINYDIVNCANVSARPVFYLTSDIKISGEGTIENPYIITN